MNTLEKEKRESSKSFAGRVLASMFQEVYSHTGREMPDEMFDRCHDLMDEVVNAVREEMQEATMRW